MYEGMRVKYLFIDLEHSTYVKLQTFLFIAFIVGGVICFIFTRDSQDWLLKNGWWLCLTGAILEAAESFLALSKAKKNFAGRATDNLQPLT